ncbi:MAG: hypothetical protein ABSB99_07600 [Acidimicrobiales bacterium]
MSTGSSSPFFVSVPQRAWQITEAGPPMRPMHGRIQPAADWRLQSIEAAHLAPPDEERKREDP